MLRYLASAVAILLLAGLFGAALIRFGPGYESDERSLDARYSSGTLGSISEENQDSPNLFAFYGRYLYRAMHGDFGTSRAFDVPVGPLIRSRVSVTVRLICLGLLGGWSLGLLLALAAVRFRWPAVNLAAETLASLALSLPAAVFALAVFLARGPVFLVLALAVFPRVFRYARDIFESARNEPRVLCARSRGVSEHAIVIRYLMRPAWSPLFALAGISFSIAFGALIPVEVVCDIPGIGQLAWKAAISRDLPVLVSLTLLVTAVTVSVNGFAQWMSQDIAQGKPR